MILDDLNAAQANRERVATFQMMPDVEPEPIGRGRLAKGVAGHFTFQPDTGCSRSPHCLTCPLPLCRLEELEKRRGG